MKAHANITNPSCVTVSFSKRTSSLRKRFIHEWVTSTTHRRALYPGICSFSLFSCPRLFICGMKPRNTTISNAGSPVYPLSRQRCCGCSNISGRSTIIEFSKVSSCDTSWRFAPVITSARGTPAPSTSIWRLLPFFSPVGRVRADCF